MEIRVRGKRIQTDYAGVGYLSMLKMQIVDDRPISQIALDFEGANRIDLHDDNGMPVETFEGYVYLIRAEKMADSRCILILSRQEAK